MSVEDRGSGSLPAHVFFQLGSNGSRFLVASVDAWCAEI